MKPVRLAVLSLFTLAACGPELDPADDSAEVTQNQNAGSPSDPAAAARVPGIWGIERDLRKCAWPGCGGYFVHRLNTQGAGIYVAELDFKSGNLGTIEQAVRAAPEADVALEGTFGTFSIGSSSTSYRTLIVRGAWLGLPGFKPASEPIYAVTRTPATCLACPGLRATKVNTAAFESFSTLSVKGVLLPHVDAEWVANRVLEHGALVAGSFVSDSKTGLNATLVAQQVYIRLPDQPGPCLVGSAPVCTGNTLLAHTRDENRCLLPAGCVHTGQCLAFVPSCTPGYRVARWLAKDGCDDFACDPAFVAP